MNRDNRYFEITESPGQKATKEQLERIYHRYRFASNYAICGDILEACCGCGLGLGYLALKANQVVACDIDKKNIEIAKSTYCTRNNIQIILHDVHKLPFEDERFNLILLFEAIYYLHDPKQFIREAYRLLMKEGHLIICTVNKEWKDFHPSKYSIQYFNADELRRLLLNDFASVTLYGAFPANDNDLINSMLSAIKKGASKLQLIPGSLKARAILKRIFYGKLAPIPREVYEGMASYDEPFEIVEGMDAVNYKIIYAVAEKK